ncbi:MAG: polyribonucleotide nucleotidyltransferase, partial [Phycisphaerales bacterium]|nr:polyribonucleotide nucleotidyltransferase [Phycisphaerales bacterium]
MTDFKITKLEREIGTQVLSIETGKLAKQAHGAALVRYGDTVVLGTAVTGPPRPGIDFFPLQVDYREKMSAAGRFPGGFFKREGRPSDKETLTMRMIDRQIRPLFPDGFYDEVQLQNFVLASDLKTDPDTIAIVASAAALAIAPLPFQGPVAGVRIGRIDGDFIINPTRAQLEYSDLDMIVAGHMKGINMIEVGSFELTEDVVLSAIKFGHEYGIVPICEMLTALREQAGKPCSWTPPEKDTSFEDGVEKFVWENFKKAKTITGKQERGDAVSKVKDAAYEKFVPADKPAEELKHSRDDVARVLDKVEKKYVRERILREGVRSDGRKLDAIRPLYCEVGFLPRVHGTSLFQRGETQAMVCTTLGTSSDEQIIDEMMEEYSKKFLLHYNFPPFSVGETRRIMGPGRREIGHGALAERSLVAVLPSPDDFPYTIRLVSDILESNGSSSMASVCGGTLALMDAGVPITAPVAGISVGMVEDGDDYVLLADILGEEDHFGDMDFKVSGTRKGITGIQLDLKTHGLTFDRIDATFKLAKKLREQILDFMAKTIDKPRAEISQFAPRLITLRINPDKI